MLILDIDFKSVAIITGSDRTVIPKNVAWMRFLHPGSVVIEAKNPDAKSASRLQAHLTLVLHVVSLINDQSR